MRKIGIPLQTPIYYIKVGIKGVYISWTCFPDVFMPLENHPKLLKQTVQTLLNVFTYIIIQVLYI